MTVPNQTGTTKLTRLKNKKKQLEDKKAKASSSQKLAIEKQLRNLRSDMKVAQASLKKTLTKSGAKSDIGEGAKNTRRLQSSNNKDIDKSASGKGIIKKGKPATVSPNQKSRQANLSVIGKGAENKPPKPRSKPKPPRPRNKDVEGIATVEKKLASKKAAQDLATQEKRSATKPTTKDVGGENIELSKKKFLKQVKNPKNKKDMSDPKKAKGYDYSSKEDDFKFEADDLNLRKGGMAKYKKGGMAKAFGMGGMYKTPKKAYGMKYGGMTKKRGRA